MLVVGVFQSVTPSRDVRAQFYSRMGLIATAAAQPSQIAVENQAPVPSCSSSAEDEAGSKHREKIANDKEPEIINSPVIVYDGKLSFFKSIEPINI